MFLFLLMFFPLNLVGFISSQWFFLFWFFLFNKWMGVSLFSGSCEMFMLFMVCGVFLLCAPLMENFLKMVFFIFISSGCFFLAQSFLLLYTFFEFTLLPIGLIILLGGSQTERAMAFFSLMFYSLFMAIPLLWVFFLGGFSPLFLCVSLSNLILIFLFLSFLIKVPIFLVHYWLPKAHVEAPTLGSMLLAGVLLKLGSWGIYILISFPILMSLNLMSIMGVLFPVLITFMQSDIKSLIAFSSICHMNFLSLSLFLKSTFSKSLSLLMNFSHAITSSLLFWVGGAFYHFFLTRQVIFLSGLGGLSISFMFLVFTVFSTNFSVPPFSAFFSEYFFCLTSYSNFSGFMFLLFIYIMGVCYYNIFLYNLMNQKNENMNFMLMIPELMFIFGIMAILNYFFWSLIY